MSLWLVDDPRSNHSLLPQTWVISNIVRSRRSSNNRCILAIHRPDGSGEGGSHSVRLYHQCTQSRSVGKERGVKGVSRGPRCPPCYPRYAPSLVVPSGFPCRTPSQPPPTCNHGQQCLLDSLYCSLIRKTIDTCSRRWIHVSDDRYM